jgi:hypothetical protein
MAQDDVRALLDELMGAGTTIPADDPRLKAVGDMFMRNPPNFGQRDYGSYKGQPGSPDLPTALDRKKLDNSGDMGAEQFVNRFGFEQLDPQNRDPKTGLRLPSYVPTPRPRYPEADENNPVGYGELNARELVDQGANFRPQDIDRLYDEAHRADLKSGVTTGPSQPNPYRDAYGDPPTGPIPPDPRFKGLEDYPPEGLEGMPERDLENLRRFKRGEEQLPLDEETLRQLQDAMGKSSAPSENDMPTGAPQTIKPGMKTEEDLNAFQKDHSSSHGFVGTGDLQTDRQNLLEMLDDSEIEPEDIDAFVQMHGKQNLPKELQDLMEEGDSSEEEPDKDEDDGR